MFPVMVTAIELAGVYRRQSIARSQPALDIKMILLFAPEKSGQGLALNGSHFRTDMRWQDRMIEAIGLRFTALEKTGGVPGKRILHDLVSQPQIDGFRFLRADRIMINGCKLGPAFFVPEGVDIGFPDDGIVKSILYKRSLIGNPGDFFQVGLIFREQTILSRLVIKIIRAEPAMCRFH